MKIERHETGPRMSKAEKVTFAKAGKIHPIKISDLKLSDPTSRKAGLIDPRLKPCRRQ